MFTRRVYILYIHTPLLGVRPHIINEYRTQTPLYVVLVLYVLHNKVYTIYIIIYRTHRCARIHAYKGIPRSRSDRLRPSVRRTRKVIKFLLRF